MIPMTNLDHHHEFHTIDPQNMMGYIADFPNQLEKAWQHAQTLDLPTGSENIGRAVFCGMGGSAIGADLLAEMAADGCRIPLSTVRGYELPAFARGPETLVVAISKSGNTEETLAAFGAAAERGARLLAITTGGRLADLTRQFGGACWTFSYDSQPRAALGWLYGLLLAVLCRMGFVRDCADDLAEATALMRAQSREFGPEIPTAQNPAKQIAAGLAGRLPVIWGAGLLEPVARRWKTQLNENAKTWAHFEAMPELNHNAVVGFDHPELIRQFTVIQLLSSRYDGKRVGKRHSITREMLAAKDIPVVAVEASGESRLAHQLTVLYQGDYVSYYLAMVNGVDPTPVKSIDYLKGRLAEADEQHE
jgi:glucose/mannose-6-phosphate isomerase